MRPITLIVVHCSATPAGRDIGRSEIDRMHKDRGFAGIGYHHVVRLNGTVEAGRAESVIGAHVSGHNANSIGVCLIGGIRDGKAAETYTAQQYASLEQLLIALRQRYPRARICGHRDLSPDRDGDGVVGRHEWLKDCPCFDVAAWCRARKISPEGLA